MMVSFGFFTYAILEALDQRIIHYSDPEEKCAVLSLCHQCIKDGAVFCKLTRMLYFLIPSFIVLAFIPLLASIFSVSYNTTIFDVFYNYSHPVIYQVFEIRYCPIYAVMLFITSFLVLLLKKNNAVGLSKVLFAAGMGPLGFAFLRLILFSLYQDNLVWFNFWEELTELMFIVGVGFTLWIFQRGLFQMKEAHGSNRDVAGAI